MDFNHYKTTMSRIFLSSFSIFLPIITVAQVVINEYSASNLSTFKDNNNAYEDWVEIYNTGTSIYDISDHYLSDRGGELKWKFPFGTTIPANGFLRIWLSGRDENVGLHYHSSFKLTQTGSDKYVLLFDENKNIIDQVEMVITQLGHSYGRTTDGDTTMSVFTSPTPNSSNNLSTPYEGYAALPVASRTAGFYMGAIDVSYTNNESNSELHYTLDGTEPTALSAIYTAPVNINQTSVLKIKAISNDPQILSSFMDINTYFIDSTYSLVVVSVTADSLEPLLNGDKSHFPHGSFEYFDVNGIRTSWGYGEFNSHGQDSWVHDQRSIDYVSRDEMGYDYAVHEKVFDISDRDEFQRLILRCEGDDNYPGIDSSAHIRDMFVQTVAIRAGAHLDVRKASRCIMYVNGKYWGVYSLREKVDDPDYTKYYYKQDKYNIQFIMTWGQTWIEYGGQPAMDDWQELYDFIHSNDMANDSAYSYVTTQMDVQSLVDYVLVNSFVVCSDWLNWNTAWWRGLNPDGTHKRWAYILWDNDATFGHYFNYTGIPNTTPQVEPCYQDNLSAPWPDVNGHILTLNKLRDNADFEQFYISRYIDLLNTGFSCDYLLPLYDSLAQVIRPEMKEHIQHWGGSLQEWENNVTKLRTFIEDRCAYVDDGLNTCYNLNGPYPVVFNVEPADVGEIKVNSLDLSKYPWEGDYFGNIDIKFSYTLTDTAYKFKEWKVNKHPVMPVAWAKNAFLRIGESDSVTAVFELKNPTVGIEEPTAMTNVYAYPNPFSKNTVVHFNAITDGSYAVVMYDLMGAEVNRSAFTTEKFVVVQRNDLSEGVYLYTVVDEYNGIVGKGKLLVQ